MKSKLVDTNVWLRYLIRDNEVQYKQATKWFEAGEAGAEVLRVVPVVIAESCYVMESYYKKDRQEIAHAWQVIIGQRWLRVENRQVITQMWVDYIKGLGWVDSYLLAWSKVEKGGILSFDKRLMKEIK